MTEVQFSLNHGSTLPLPGTLLMRDYLIEQTSPLRLDFLSGLTPRLIDLPEANLTRRALTDHVARRRERRGADTADHGVDGAERGPEVGGALRCGVVQGVRRVGLDGHGRVGRELAAVLGCGVAHEGRAGGGPC